MCPQTAPHKVDTSTSTRSSTTIGVHVSTYEPEYPAALMIAVRAGVVLITM
jgi:hypothetical protein